MDRGLIVALYEQLSGDSNLTFTSLTNPNIIDLSVVTHMLEITLLTVDDIYIFSRGIEESTILSGKVFVSVDFVSITSFNLPAPVPLTFLERWAG